jgi:hypothetical protein
LVPVGGRCGCGNQHAAFRGLGHLSGGAAVIVGLAIIIAIELVQ